jgi:hypothetical protein
VNWETGNEETGNGGKGMLAPWVVVYASHLLAVEVIPRYKGVTAVS